METIFLASLIAMACALLGLSSAALAAVHFGRPRTRPRLDGWVQRRFVEYRKSSNGEIRAYVEEETEEDLGEPEPVSADAPERVRDTGRLKLVPV